MAVNVNITINGQESYNEGSPVPAAKRIEIGDTVQTKYGGSFVVKGYLLGHYYPDVEDIRALVEPLYPAGSDVHVVKLGEIVGYVDNHDGDGYGGDSIFWGT